MQIPPICLYYFAFGHPGLVQDIPGEGIGIFYSFSFFNLTFRPCNFGMVLWSNSLTDFLTLSLKIFKNLNFATCILPRSLHYFGRSLHGPVPAAPGEGMGTFLRILASWIWPSEPVILRFLVVKFSNWFFDVFFTNPNFTTQILPRCFHYRSWPPCSSPNHTTPGKGVGSFLRILPSSVWPSDLALGEFLFSLQIPPWILALFRLWQHWASLGHAWG